MADLLNSFLAVDFANGGLPEDLLPNGVGAAMRSFLLVVGRTVGVFAAWASFSSFSSFSSMCAQDLTAL